MPFGALRDQQRQFIDPKYLPPGFHFEDPRNIKKELILKFCRHILERQAKVGVAEAFRFIKYQRGKEMVSAEYGTHADEERAAAKALKQKEAREARAINKKDKSKKSKGKKKAVERQGTPEREQMPVVQVDLGIEQGRADRALSIPIDPVLLSATNVSPVSAMLPTNADSRGILIDESDMTILTEMGHEPLIPINGPNDALVPLYSISSSAREMLKQAKDTGRKAGPSTLAESEPEQTVKRVSTRKRGKNADARAAEEAHRILGTRGQRRGAKRSGRT